MDDSFLTSKYPLWTQEESVAYECAREVITDLSSICTSRIYGELDKKTPDHGLVASLRARRTRLFNERRGLMVENQEEIARVRKEYGAEVRAWRAHEQIVNKLNLTT